MYRYAIINLLPKGSFPAGLVPFHSPSHTRSTNVKIRCPHCGKEFDNSEQYCPACGRAAPVNNTDQKPKPRRTSPDNKAPDPGKFHTDHEEAGINKILLGAVILLLMLLCAAIGYILGRQPDKPGTGGSTTTAATSGETEGETTAAASGETESGMAGSTQSSSFEHADTSQSAYGQTEPEQSKPQQPTYGQTESEQAKPQQSTYGQTESEQADQDKVYSDPLDPGKTEEMVSQVTNNYNAIRSRVDSGRDTRKDYQGMTVYYYNGRPEMIHVPESASINDYTEDYYYKDGTLIFSYYENYDFFRYYFMNEQLIRYTYGPSKEDPADAHNSDFGYSTYEFAQRGEKVLGSSYYYLDIISKAEGKKVAQTPEAVTMDMITSITASSWKTEPEYDQYHYPENMLDGDLTTAWCEDVKGDGVGEMVTVYFDRKCKISGLYIYAGYHKSKDLFNKNNVPIQILVRGDDRTEVLTLDANMKRQKLNFTAPMYTEHFSLEIRKVHKGTTYDDTLITDIKFY